MTETIQIRFFRAADLPHVEALEARIQPYRPEDETEVQAMFARALQAEQKQDARWTPPSFPPRSISEEFDAFWVAEPTGQGTPGLAGIIGVQTFRAGEVIPASHPLVPDWQSRGRVAELRRLRVAPERRGHGLGSRLCQTVLEWARVQGIHTLVVNTTTPQVPALQLYRKLGFREVGLSFVGRYELVLLELVL